jgi:uncharacterized membrane protein YqjE
MGQWGWRELGRERWGAGCRGRGKPLLCGHMTRLALRRRFFIALAILLAAFAGFSVLAVVLSVAEDRYANHDTAAIAIAIVLVLALAALAGWLGRRAWRSSVSMQDDPK